MNSRTADQLHTLNLAFYRHHSASFDRTRQRPWPGWQKLLPLCDHGRRPLRVLDAGCGNGRFGAFLVDNFAVGEVDYVGIDSSEPLLAAAEDRLHDTLPECELQPLDLLADDLSEKLGGQGFDWIVLFGVLHHVAGFANRVRLLADLGSLLAPGGLLGVSLWRFDRDPRQARKILPWPEQLGGQPLDRSQLEAGDHLLSWTGDRHHPRYCHVTDEPEADRLVEAAGLRQLVRLADADGPGAGGNDYLVLAPGAGAGP